MRTALRSLVTRAEDLALNLKLPPVTHVKAELRRLGLIRIAAATVLLLRTVGILIGFQYYPQELPFGGFMLLPAEPIIVMECVLLLMVVVGFATPIALLGVFLTYPQMDARIGTSTLGTTIAETLIFVLLLSGSGLARSVDARLLATPKATPVHALIARIYGVLGAPTARRIEVAYAWGFLTFALVSFAAIFHHLKDPTWLRGDTSRILLATSYLSDLWRVARWSEEVAPLLAAVVSYIGIFGQSVFQLAMIPLAFSRYGIWFVALWGWVFILGSTIGIKIAFLPFIEVLLWWAIFHPSKRAVDPETKVRMQFGLPAREGIAELLSGCYLFGLLLFFPAYIPPTQAIADAMGLPTNRARQVLLLTNLHSPNVFNGIDLKMGDAWPVIEREGKDGFELVPFNGLDGERGWYHLSDMLYYGNSVQWRRFQIGKDAKAHNGPGGDGRGKLEKTAIADYRFTGQTGTVRYRITIFECDCASPDRPSPERFAKRIGYSFSVDVRNGLVVFQSDAAESAESADAARGSESPGKTSL